MPPTAIAPADAPDAVAGPIPGPLLAKLRSIRDLLIEQGCLQVRPRHRTRDWRIRYRMLGDGGYVRHCSLGLGDDDQLAAAVWRLIEVWRAERQAATLEQERATRITQREREKLRLQRSIAVALAGGGWRRRKTVGRWFDGLLERPFEATRFATGGDFPPIRRPGRPRKQESWGTT